MKPQIATCSTSIFANESPAACDLRIFIVAQNLLATNVTLADGSGSFSFAHTISCRACPKHPLVVGYLRHLNVAAWPWQSSADDKSVPEWYYCGGGQRRDGDEEEHMLRRAHASYSRHGVMALLFSKRRKRKKSREESQVDRETTNW